MPVLQGAPDRRRTRTGWACAVASAGLALAQCDRAPAPPSAPSEAPSPPPPAPAPPLPKPTALSRADLVSAMAAAASAYAAGEAPAGASIAGRTFAVRIPFGCFGPQDAPEGPGDGLARWSWTKDMKSIRLQMGLADWTRAPMVGKAGEGADWEAVEGVWIARPWLAAETCPPAAAQAPESPRPQPSPQTAGLAILHEAASSRLERRNSRDYAHVIQSEGGAPPAAPAKGYRLALEGRIAAFPDGQPARCHAPGPDQRPTCVAAVQLDKVAFEDGATGEILSEWGPG